MAERSGLAADSRSPGPAGACQRRGDVSRGRGLAARRECWGAPTHSEANQRNEEAVHNAVHEDSGSARIAAGQRPRPSFRHPHAGNSYSCALRTDNTITCWGNNNYGQTDAPDGQYTTITANNSHSCALRTDNTITCWPTLPDGVRWAAGDG